MGSSLLLTLGQGKSKGTFVQNVHKSNWGHPVPPVNEEMKFGDIFSFTVSK